MSRSLPIRKRCRSRAPAAVSRSVRVLTAASISSCSLLRASLPSTVVKCAFRTAVITWRSSCAVDEFWCANSASACLIASAASPSCRSGPGGGLPGGLFGALVTGRIISPVCGSNRSRCCCLILFRRPSATCGLTALKLTSLKSDGESPRSQALASPVHSWMRSIASWRSSNAPTPQPLHGGDSTQRRSRRQFTRFERCCYPAETEYRDRSDSSRAFFAPSS